jgi:hypothetical protein
LELFLFFIFCVCVCVEWSSELPPNYSWCHQCHQMFSGCSGTVICLLAKNSLTDTAVWAGALSWCRIHELLAQSSGHFHLTFSCSLFSTSTW